MSELEKFAARHAADPTELRRRLVEAMVLGAVADGEFDQRESDSVIEVIARTAEFTGMSAPELRESLERAMAGIVNDGFQVRLHALAGALPRYAHRVLAFRSAVFVAYGNGSLAHDEVTFLKQMQRVLGITETDVASAFEDAQGLGGPLGDPNEPIDAYLDCLLLAAAADRELRDEELATVIAFVISRSEFDGMDEDVLNETIQRRLQDFVSGGAAARLESLAFELETDDQRENAYGLAAAMCMADGDFAPAEVQFLETLGRKLGLDEDQLAALEQRITNG